jgi:hypothetical protein
MDLTKAIKLIQDNLAQVTAIVVSLGVLGGAAIKLRSYLSRSRLRIPNAFPLPEIPGEQAIFAEQLTELPTLLVGRETETRELARAVQNYRLTFLYGESGSGKSTVLKLGLARESAGSVGCGISRPRPFLRKSPLLSH